MIKIDKTPIPQHFESAIKNLEKWEDYRGWSKKQLKKDLASEQYYICAYCECKLELNNSHVEHMYPRSKYPHKIFDYTNLVKSCNGYKDEVDKNERSCGHRKDNEFNEETFLDPTKIENIQEYFIYDKDNGYILPNELLDAEKKIQAQEMINLLNLNSNPIVKGFALPEARKKAKLNFVLAFKEKKINIHQLKNLLQKPQHGNYLAFISFLRYCFDIKK